MKENLKAFIKRLHRIPVEDELDIETEVFLDYFATELLRWFKENKDELDAE